jgi:hypothetical protein
MEVSQTPKLKAVIELSSHSPLDAQKATGIDYDVFMGIKYFQKLLTTATELKWVKGHNVSPGIHIKYKLNWTAHDNAVAFLKKTHTPGYESTHHPVNYPSHRVSVYHKGDLIPSNLQSIIRRTYYVPPMQCKLQKDNNRTTATFESIDWASFQSAMSSLPKCERISICKLTNGLWNTNSQNQ